MSKSLVERVEALEKAVQSLLGAVNLLEKLFEKNSGLRGSGSRRKKTAENDLAKKKKRAPVTKRVSGK